MGTALIYVDEDTGKITGIYFQAEHDKAVERLRRIIERALRPEAFDGGGDGDRTEDAEASKAEGGEALKHKAEVS